MNSSPETGESGAIEAVLPKPAQALGYVDFDEKAHPDLQARCTVNVRQENLDKLQVGKYVYIYSPEGRVFLGRAVAGPFHRPKTLSPSSQIAKTFTVEGDMFDRPPPYYGVYVVELLGEVAAGTLRSTHTRPKPKSPVTLVQPERLRSLLGIDGDMVIGHMLGYKGVKVALPSSSPDFLPRNLGIFGTVGSGKTNTAQVIIEEALKGGWSVFVLDVEGEYTYMDLPNDDDRLARVLESVYGMQPEGVKDFQVYVPVGRASTRTGAKPFGAPFSDIDPYVFSEIIEATEPQQRYLGRIVDAMKEEAGEETRDELEELIAPKPRRQITLKDVIERTEDTARNAERFMKTSLTALLTKLERLQRLQFIDQAPPINLATRMKPGALTVIDLNDAEDKVKNIAIAWLLNKIFRLKLAGQSAKTMIVIEEAHSFVSLETREKMAATLEMLKVIARRGRKRWLSLVFVSQQPGHLPGEIFELCNTRITHAMRSQANLKAIQRTSTATPEHLAKIPGLAPGEALITSPKLPHPILTKIRPAKTRKLKF
ncbi:MAG: ATP-binding protein [Thermoproteales archaeon]|nr:ATP-binding protein [Thermoproteales archaeon]